MMASTSASSASVNFSPPPENTLMPLSWNGLWDAEMTRPAAKPWLRVRCATAGVGMTPALTTVAPAAVAPTARSRSMLLTGLARVAAHQQPRRAGAPRQRLHERHAEPADGPRVERRRAGPAADTIGAEQFRRSSDGDCAPAGDRRGPRRTARDGATRTGSVYRPAPRPVRSTDASRRPTPSVFSVSIVAAHGHGDVRRSRLRAAARPGASCMRTGTPLMARSVRTGWMSTVTTALCGDRAAAPSCSRIPIADRLADLRGRRLQRRSAPSWPASGRAAALSGPTTSTSAGSTVTRRTSYPGAGSPSPARTTGTFLTHVPLEDQRHRRRARVAHLHAERRTHVVRGEVELVPAGLGRGDVQDRLHVARRSRPEARRRCPAPARRSCSGPRRPVRARRAGSATPAARAGCAPRSSRRPPRPTAASRCRRPTALSPKLRKGL